MNKIVPIILFCLVATMLCSQVIPPYSSGQNIVYAEYFIDADPGYGNGESTPLSARSDLVLNFDITVDTLPAGMHKLHVTRTRCFRKVEHDAASFVF